MAQVTFSPNTRILSADVNANFTELYGAKLGYAQVTANQGSITTEVDLTGLSVTVTVPTGGRSIRITGSCLLQTSGEGYAYLSIKESTTQLNLCRQYADFTGQDQSFLCQAILTPTAGSHTYKLAVARASGSGTWTMDAAATYPAFILVEMI